MLLTPFLLLLSLFGHLSIETITVTTEIAQVAAISTNKNVRVSLIVREMEKVSEESSIARILYQPQPTLLGRILHQSPITTLVKIQEVPSLEAAAHARILLVIITVDVDKEDHSQAAWATTSAIVEAPGSGMSRIHPRRPQLYL